MVILKKIQASTLVEVLTASVLIIIVFMIASLSFNNVFANQIKRDHSAIQNRVKELEYFSIHNVIKLPYTEDFDEWEIMITAQGEKTVLLYSKEGVEHEKILLINE